MIRALIVDDEKEGREVLKNMLSDYFDDIEIVGMVASAIEAMKMIQKHTLDVVFLDVQMPHGTGFDVLEAFPERKFEVVFITAHQQYAIEAIRESATDYLVKPIDIDDLEATIERIRTTSQSDKAFSTNQKIALPTSNGLMYVVAKDIVRIEAQRSYSEFHFSNGSKQLVSKNLKEYEDLLQHQIFYRCHRSHIINLQHVQQYIRTDGGAIEMMDGSRVEISRDKKDDFLKLMEQL